MQKLLISLTLCLSLSGPISAASTSDEIQHLLNFVASSGCTFERNGSEYDSLEAKAHIQRKYNHISNRVNTTEDFIRHAASKSSMSGRKYYTTCDDQTLSSEDWLTAELERYRLHPN